MGQKVNPIGLRLGITTGWDSKWYAEKNKYTNLLHEDIKIRSLIKKTFYQAGISKIEIERAASERVRVVIYSIRPGILIGRKGQEIEVLRRKINKITGKEIYRGSNDESRARGSPLTSRGNHPTIRSDGAQRSHLCSRSMSSITNGCSAR